MPKSKEDKEWAKRYILDPLTAPEPSQLDGPGTSFFNPQRSLSLNCKPKEVPLSILHRRHSGYPTAPRSAGPTSTTFQIHHPKPISPGRRHSYLPPTDWAPAEVVLRRTQSLNPSSQRQGGVQRSQSLTSSAQKPKFETSQDRPPIRRKPVNVQQTQPSAPEKDAATTALAAQIVKSPGRAAKSKDQPEKKPHTAQPAAAIQSKSPPQPPAKSPAKLRKAPSSSPPNKAKPARKPPQTHHTQGTAEILSGILVDKTSIYINRPLPVAPTPDSPSPVDHTPKPPSKSAETPPRTRPRSFMLVPPKDKRPQSPNMDKSTSPPPGQSSSSHKHRSRRNRPVADTIDSLDQVGGLYHHGGPYDATLAAVNANKKRSPVEALRNSNKEALKATPREYIRDSLTKHVPLQGTANLPSGVPDQYGNVLHYKEGADLMREADAAGGAYRRYDFIQYQPDDLKGKGEPSYSIEKSLKENSSKLRKGSVSGRQRRSSVYEMEDHHRDRRREVRGPTPPPKDAGVSVRRQSFSHASGSDYADHGGYDYKGDRGITRRNSVSQRLTDGILRRLGSLRRK